MEILSREEQITPPYPSQIKWTVLLSMHTAGDNHCSEKKNCLTKEEYGIKSEGV